MEANIKSKEEILAKLQKRTIIDPVSGCWLWTGALNSVTHGHGIIRLWKFSPKYYVHRLSAYLFLDYSLSDPSRQVNHHCPNQNCWNPDHIYVGTQAENNEDKWKHAGKDGPADFRSWCAKRGIKHTSELK